MRFWINTISRAHVRLGVAGGFTQADHGKDTRLRRLDREDVIAFYSPRTEMRAGDPVQAFTAIGRIADDEPYQVEMRSGFHPWRRRVVFLEAREAPIRSLVDGLDFVPDKQHWGYPFRRGLFEIGPEDMERIATAMGVDLTDQR